MKSAIVPNLREWNECRADRLWGGTDCCRMIAETKGREGRRLRRRRSLVPPLAWSSDKWTGFFLFLFCFCRRDIYWCKKQENAEGRVASCYPARMFFSSTFCFFDERVSAIFFGVFLLVLVIITWLFSMLLLVLPPRLDADVATVAVAAALPPLKAPKVFFFFQQFINREEKRNERLRFCFLTLSIWREKNRLLNISIIIFIDRHNRCQFVCRRPARFRGCLETWWLSPQFFFCFYLFVPKVLERKKKRKLLTRSSSSEFKFLFWADD